MIAAKKTCYFNSEFIFFVIPLFHDPNLLVTFKSTLQTGIEYRHSAPDLITHYFPAFFRRSMTKCAQRPVNRPDMIPPIIRNGRYPITANEPKLTITAAI